MDSLPLLFCMPFECNAETGEIRWLIAPSKGVKVGDVCKPSVSGYVAVKVYGKRIYGHRIMWRKHNGPIPAGMVVDHINGDRSDNRLCNLRLATDTQNKFNAKARSHNVCGLKGVTWHKKAGKWTAMIAAEKKHMYLGLYETAELAHQAYKLAANKYHGEFANHG